jgi:hypothetical protein
VEPLMPNQHKNKLIGWNPDDPTLRPWVEGQAEQRGVTLKAICDEALAEYRQRKEGETCAGDMALGVAQS